MEKADRVRARLLRPPTSPNRSVPALHADLQRRADQALEVMALLGQAEKLGLSAGKARVIRERLRVQNVDARTLHRVGRRLRAWIDLRFDRVLASW
jgi:hypothetical protein